jgi:hypothetical protein
LCVRKTSLVAVYSNLEMTSVTAGGETDGISCCSRT